MSGTRRTSKAAATPQEKAQEMVVSFIMNGLDPAKPKQFKKLQENIKALSKTGCLDAPFPEDHQNKFYRAKTLFSILVEYQDAVVVRSELIENGADPSAAGFGQASALTMLSTKKEFPKFLEELLRHYSNTAKAEESVANGGGGGGGGDSSYGEKAKQKLKAILEKEDGNRQTPMMCAVRGCVKGDEKNSRNSKQGSLENVRLMDEEYNVDITGNGVVEDSALYNAIDRGQVSIVDYLIKKLENDENARHSIKQSDYKALFKVVKEAIDTKSGLSASDRERMSLIQKTLTEWKKSAPSGVSKKRGEPRITKLSAEEASARLKKDLSREIAQEKSMNGGAPAAAAPASSAMAAAAPEEAKAEPMECDESAAASPAEVTAPPVAPVVKKSEAESMHCDAAAAAAIPLAVSAVAPSKEKSSRESEAKPMDVATDNATNAAPTSAVMDSSGTAAVVAATAASVAAGSDAVMTDADVSGAVLSGGAANSASYARKFSADTFGAVTDEASSCFATEMGGVTVAAASAASSPPIKINWKAKPKSSPSLSPEVESFFSTTDASAAIEGPFLWGSPWTAAAAGTSPASATSASSSAAADIDPGIPHGRVSLPPSSAAAAEPVLEEDGDVKMFHLLQKEWKKESLSAPPAAAPTVQASAAASAALPTAASEQKRKTPLRSSSRKIKSSTADAEKNAMIQAKEGADVERLTKEYAASSEEMKASVIIHLSQIAAFLNPDQIAKAFLNSRSVKSEARQVIFIFPEGKSEKFTKALTELIKLLGKDKTINTLRVERAKFSQLAFIIENLPDNISVLKIHNNREIMEFNLQTGKSRDYNKLKAALIKKSNKELFISPITTDESLMWQLQIDPELKEWKINEMPKGQQQSAVASAGGGGGGGGEAMDVDAGLAFNEKIAKPAAASATPTQARTPQKAKSKSGKEKEAEKARIDKEIAGMNVLKSAAFLAGSRSAFLAVDVDAKRASSAAKDAPSSAGLFTPLATTVTPRTEDASLALLGFEQAVAIASNSASSAAAAAALPLPLPALASSAPAAALSLPVHKPTSSAAAVALSLPLTQSASGATMPISGDSKKQVATASPEPAEKRQRVGNQGEVKKLEIRGVPSPFLSAFSSFGSNASQRTVTAGSLSELLKSGVPRKRTAGGLFVLPTPTVNLGGGGGGGGGSVGPTPMALSGKK